jgi:biotin operon repressor
VLCETLEVKRLRRFVKYVVNNMSTKLVSGPAMAQILGISHKRFQQLADEGVFKQAEAEGCTIDEIAGELNEAFAGDTILSRIDLAASLKLSPNRVSELVRMGVLQPVSLEPLRFSLEYSRACYGDYKWWLKHKEDGESYAD